MPDYPFVEFTVAVGTWETGDEAYPDTAFRGGLAIPLGVGREILAEADITRIRLADGTVLSVPSWSGTLDLSGRRFGVEVVAVGTGYLLGRDVLDRLEICFEFGKTVRLRFGDEPLGEP